MINYGYFRHRFDAHKNKKLNDFVDDVGFVGFAYYYTLLEVYGEVISKSNNKNSAIIHERVISNVWRKRSDYVALTMSKLSSKDLLRYSYDGSSYTLDIPNYLKYYGSYKKTEPEIRLIKENKIKEKESNPLSLTPDEVINIWNQEMGNDFGYASSLGANKHLKNCIESIQYLQTEKDWLDLFNKIKESEFLSGKQDGKWKANLTWIVDYDNAIKVLNGSFDNGKNIRNLFSSIGESNG